MATDPTTCPISVHQIWCALVRGDFRPFNHDDQMAFNGGDGEGFTWEPKGAEPPIKVIADLCEQTVRFEVHRQQMDGDNDVWTGTLQLAEI